MLPLSTPWKKQKTVRFSDVFRGQRKGACGKNGLTRRKIVEKFIHDSSKSVSELLSYKIELRKMTSQFELLTRNFLQIFFFRVTNSMVQLSFFPFQVPNSKLKNKKFHFKLLKQTWKKSFTSNHQHDGLTCIFPLLSY